MQADTINQTNPFIRAYYMDPKVCDGIMSVIQHDPDTFDGLRENYQGYRNRFLEWMPEEVKRPYYNSLWNIMEQYKQEFEHCYLQLGMWTLRHGVRVQHYPPGYHYSGYHCENEGRPDTNIMHLVFMTYLNDVDQGGGTEFLYQGLQTRPEKGLTLVWPAEWTHTHRGIVAPAEDKYITTGWFVFDNTQGSREYV